MHDRLHNPLQSRTLRFSAGLFVAMALVFGAACDAGIAQDGKAPKPMPIAMPQVPNADGPKPMPAQFHQNLRGVVNDPPHLRHMGHGVKWEPAGARITLPAGEGVQKASGVAMNFRVQGDFEISTTYEILNADKPKAGYGVGASLYVSLMENGRNDNSVSLARRLAPAGTSHFSSNRMMLVNGKIKDNVKSAPSVHPIGKLRIQRVGARVRFFIADGENADFVPLSEAAIDRDDAHFVQIGGSAGNSDAGLDMRILDFTIRAEALPDRVEPVPAGNAAAVEAEQPRAWLVAAAAIAAAVFLLLAVIGIGCLVIVKRRHAADIASDQGEAEPLGEDGLITFACPECNKPLKIRASAAGKKLKCPGCKAVVSSEQIRVK
jgi:hypothetical protein